MTLRTIKAISYMQKYACLMDKCNNDCCHSWTVEVDKSTLNKWAKEAPELLESTEVNPFRPETIRMQSQGEHKSCIQLQGGICNIHKTRGADMLPDICNYFPQLYKNFSGKTTLLATPACPAIAQLVMDENEDENFKIVETEYEVKKNNDRISEYLSAKPSYDIYKVFEAIINYSKEFSTASDYLASLSFACELIHQTKRSNLNENIDMILKLSHKSNKFYEIDREFEASSIAIVGAFLKAMTTRTKPVISQISQVMADFCTDLKKANHIKNKWLNSNDGIKAYQKFLFRFIKAKLSESLFPFGVLDDVVTEIKIIMAEFVTLKTVMCAFYAKGLLNPALVSDLVHSIDREFYAKKRTRITDNTKEFNLDLTKNLLSCL